MSDAAVDQGTPDGLGNVRRQVLGLGGGKNLGHHVLDASLIMDGVAVRLDARGGVLIAMAIGDLGEEGAI